MNWLNKRKEIKKMFEIYLEDLTEQAKERLSKEVDINEINEDMPIAILESEV